MPSRNRYGRPKLASPLPSHTKQIHEAASLFNNKSTTKIEQRQRQQEVKSLILSRLNLSASPCNMRLPSLSPPRHEEEEVQPLVQRQRVGDHQREVETTTYNQLGSPFNDDEEENPVCCVRVGKGYTKHKFTILLWALISLAIVNRFFVHMASDFDDNSLDAINLNLVDPPEDSSTLKRH